MLNYKRGVEALVATVLMVGITLATFGITYTYVFPIVKEGIQKSQKCGEAQLYVDSSKGFTCYDASTNQLQVMALRGANDYDLGGIGVSVGIGGASKRYDILSSPNPYVRMINGEYGGPISLPKPNDGKVYVLNVNGKVDEVSIAPLINLGNSLETCNIKNSVKDIPSCSAFIPLNLVMYRDQDTVTLSNSWGWAPTGFAALRSGIEYTEGNYSLRVTGKGSAGFNPNVGVDKATTLRFSYKKDPVNPDAYLSLFYHILGDGANEWIEVTDVSDRGYKGSNIIHRNDAQWHTEDIVLSSFQDVGQCSGFSVKGVIDNFQFAVWNSSAVIYFDNAYFY